MLEDENEDWYDADGNCDENGCFDAGGHFYSERGAAAGDDYKDRMQDRDMGL